MRLIVTDANIFIDMEAGGLLEEMFRLDDFEFTVPDILYIEELAERHAALPGLGLRIMSLSPDDVGYADRLKDKYTGPSQNDLFALALAHAERCPLLSGDEALRNAATAEEVEVHGTIWLIEHLLAAGVATVERVTAAYERMKSDGSRLPWAEVRRQIKQWSQTQQ